LVRQEICLHKAYLVTNLVPYSLALAAGATYALSAIFSKKALDCGAGTFRSLVWSNWAITLCFLPYPFLADGPISMMDFKEGVLVGVLFFFAQMSCFVALRRGDASIVTSVMGSKSLFVALFLVLLQFESNLPGKLWISAALAGIAVGLLGWPNKHYTPHLLSLILAIFTSACFGLVDALVPQFARYGDKFNMLFVMVATVGVLSIPVIPLCREKFFEWQPEADKWLLWGSILVAGQAVLMSIAVGFYNVPTEVNILYASRGLWSIVFAMWLGKSIGLNDASSNKAVATRRIIGASLLVVGIVLIAQ